MKVLCKFFSIFTLFHICQAAPTESNLFYTVTDQLQFIYDAEVSEQEEQFIGMPCNFTCSKKLFNVECHEKTKTCQCNEEFPVQLSSGKGCAKSSSLGEQCIYSESCTFRDAFSTCVQISHNAYCHCITGYHEVFTQKSTKKAFCSKDILQMAKDLPTFLFVISAVAILSMLLCLVLKLFVGKSNIRERSVITTRLLSSSELAQVARSLRQSDQSRTHSRRGSRGVTVSSSRATAARAAAILLVSCHLNQELPGKSLDSQARVDSVGLFQTQSSERSSLQSFSARQFKRESDQKIARSRQMCNQTLSSSLEPLSLPEKSVQRKLHSSSLNDLMAPQTVRLDRTANFSLSEDVIAT